MKPKAFGQDGPAMGGLCDILEKVAPNVSELQLFGNDSAKAYYQFCKSVFRLHYRPFGLVLRHSVTEGRVTCSYFHLFTLNPRTLASVESGWSSCSTPDSVHFDLCPVIQLIAVFALLCSQWG